MPRRMSPATRRRALEALDVYRRAQREGFHITLEEAARQAKSSIRSMRRIAGTKAVRKSREGDWIYSPRDDTGVRTTSILARSPRGPEWREIKVRGWYQASRAGKFARAVQDGKWSKVAGFEGGYLTDASGKRHYFETRRAEIERLDRQGLLRVPGLRFTG
jgi:hypothetical protein